VGGHTRKRERKRGEMRRVNTSERELQALEERNEEERKIK
jgi:hypothetical protein